MRINQNISAMNTHASMLKADSNISKSLERLSSGLRINRAADDAAGLAISEKMRGQIRGLQQATKNAQDGISLLQTAEGALNESHSILQRMRELAVQASNGTLTDGDRGEIQKEMDQLTKEVDRIAKDTEFNTMKLLRGNASDTGVTAGAFSAGMATATVTGGTAASGAGNEVTMDFGTAFGSGNFAEGQSVTINGTTFTAGASGANGFAVAGTLSGTLDNLATAVDTALGSDYTVNGSGTDLVIAKAAGSGVITNASISATQTGTVTLGSGGITEGTVLTVAGQEFTLTANTTASGLATLISDATGLTATASGSAINITSTVANTTASVSTPLDLTMQIGANAGQSMGISINNMDAGSLGIGRAADGSANAAGTDAAQGLNVSSAEEANASITAIDNAISTVSQERSRLGAYQNRLDHTISNLSAASENLSSSESRIRDVDMAAEMANFSKAQILMQASTSMMAQANQKPQAVLKLLG